MSDSKFLRFQCSTCKSEEFVEATYHEESSEFDIDHTWPLGWLQVYSHSIGLSEGIKDTYCTDCRTGVLHILGYPDYKTYVSVVKANAEIERSSSDSNELTDVPFYLLETDDDSN